MAVVFYGLTCRRAANTPHPCPSPIVKRKPNTDPRRNYPDPIPLTITCIALYGLRLLNVIPKFNPQDVVFITWSQRMMLIGLYFLLSLVLIILHPFI